MSLPGGSTMVLSSAGFAEPLVFNKVLFSKEYNVPSTVLLGNGAPLPEPKRKLHTHPFNFSWPFRRVGSGLRNLKNTCFLASVIQCLQHIPVWYNYLTQQHRLRCHENVHKCVVCMLHRLAFESFRTFCAISPTDLVENIKNIGSHMERGQQEDAHDFLLCLLNKMQENLIAGLGKLDPRTEMTTAVGQIFGGYLRSQIICRGCHHASNSYEPFFNISLEIKTAVSLKEALMNFVSPESMEDEEWYPCEVCKEKRRAEKRYTIHELPNVLVIHFKRYSQEGTRQTKLGQHIQFDERIDVAPYLSSACLEPTIFQLNGVLVHMGYNIGSGHYYSYIADPSTTLNGGPTSWHKMNDEYVSMSDWSTVKASQAYILFYSKSNRKCNLTKNTHCRPYAVVAPLRQPNIVSSASTIVKVPLRKDDSQTSNSPVFGPVQRPCVQHPIPSLKSAEEMTSDRSNLPSPTAFEETQSITTVIQQSTNQKSLMIPRIIFRKKCLTEKQLSQNIVPHKPKKDQLAFLSINSNLLEDEEQIDVHPESNVTTESNLLEVIHQGEKHASPANIVVSENGEQMAKTERMEEAQETSPENTTMKNLKPVVHSNNHSPLRSVERCLKRKRSSSGDSESRKKKHSPSNKVHKVSHRHSDQYSSYRHQRDRSNSIRIYRNRSDHGYGRINRSRSRDCSRKSSIPRRHESKSFKRRETRSRTPISLKDKQISSFYQKNRSPRPKTNSRSRKENKSSRHDESSRGSKDSKSPRHKESIRDRKYSRSPKRYRESKSPRRQRNYRKRYDSRDKHERKHHRNRSRHRNHSKRRSSTGSRQ